MSALFLRNYSLQSPSILIRAKPSILPRFDRVKVAWVVQLPATYKLHQRDLHKKHALDDIYKIPHNYIYNLASTFNVLSNMKSKKKKISTILSADLLSEASGLTRLNQTDTLTLALQELIRSYKRKSILNMKGKMKIDFDVDRDRERSRF